MALAGKNRNSFRLMMATGFVALALTGCADMLSMETDTNAPQKRVRLESGPSFQSMPVAAMDEKTLRGIADQYRRLGDGTAELTVTYDPRSKRNTALNATENAARIAEELRFMGMRTVSTSILPVNMQGEESQVMLQYNAVTAHAPEGCDYMGGLDGKATGADMDYKYGCTTEMLLARQIARPKDLSGRADLSAADGRRQAIATENYRTATQPPVLSGYSSTD